jgi:hypothetical protein
LPQERQQLNFQNHHCAPLQLPQFSRKQFFKRQTMKTLNRMRLKLCRAIFLLILPALLTDMARAISFPNEPTNSPLDSWSFYDHTNWTSDYGYAWYAEQGLNPFTASMGGQDPDLDGLVNYQEYQFGTRPLVSEGSAIWVSTPNGTTSIP